MSIEFKTKDLKDEPTLSEIKEFAADLCTELSDAFNGFQSPSVVIALSQMLELVLGQIESDTFIAMNKKLLEMSPESMIDAMESLKSVSDGDGLPSVEDVHQSTGEMMGYVSMLRLAIGVRRQLLELKVVMASTSMTFSERANSLTELSDLLDIDISDEEKHKIRNKLKGGSFDPVDVKSGKDLNDLCDDLFG